MITEKQIKDKAEYELSQQQLIRNYKNVFESESGKKVLDDLVQFCGQDRSSVNEQVFNENQTMFCEGKRRVYLHIQSILNRKVTQ